MKIRLALALMAFTMAACSTSGNTSYWGGAHFVPPTPQPAPGYPTCTGRALHGTPYPGANARACQN